MKLLSLQTLEYLCDSPRDLLPKTYSKNQDTCEIKMKYCGRTQESEYLINQYPTMKGDFLSGDDEIKERDRMAKKLNNQEQHMSLNIVLTPCPLQGPVNSIWFSSLSLSLLIPMSVKACYLDSLWGGICKAEGIISWVVQVGGICSYRHPRMYQWQQSSCRSASAAKEMTLMNIDSVLR